MLIDANALLLDRHPGAATRSRAASYRQSYTFDARNSCFEGAQRRPDFVVVRRHRALRAARRVIPPPSPRPTPFPPPPSTASRRPQPVPRLPLQLREAARRRRCARALADARIGHFDDRRLGLHHRRPKLHRRSVTTSTAGGSRRRIRRRRCPSRSSRSSSGSTATSRRSTAPTMRDGVLEWNKAFERIGFKDAIDVEDQPDDADFDTFDARHASIRWMTTARPASAHRSVAGRPAHRRDPRRRHRHRRLDRCATARFQRVEQIRRSCRSRAASRRTRTYLCQCRRRRGAGVGLRADAPRSARRHRAGRSRGGGVHARRR